MNWKKPLFMTLGAAIGLTLAGYVVGQQPAEPSAPAAPAPTQSAPPLAPQTAPSVQISDDARPLLNQLVQAYKQVKNLDIQGTLKASFDVNGEKVDQTAEFTAAYAAPNQFRHEMKDSLLVGSTGKKVFIYSIPDKVYKTEDLPPGALNLENLMYPTPMVLARQNPALMLVLSVDPGHEVTQGAQSVNKAADTTIDGKAYPTLQVVGDQGDVSLVIDPQTHLLRRMDIDMKRVLEAQGQNDIKHAQIVFDYTRQDTAATFATTQFDWTPPEGAKDANTLAQNQKSQNPSEQLVGTVAPDFKLKSLDGAEVSLASQKGQVVVLDFWATWCPPCVESLPHLDKFAKNAGDGVKVYAINLQEDHDVAQKFMTDKGLSLAVLLDSDGAVAQKYLVQAIPSTMVIGKDGKIAATFIGAGQEAGIEQAVKQAQSASH